MAAVIVSSGRKLSSVHTESPASGGRGDGPGVGDESCGGSDPVVGLLRTGAGMVVLACVVAGIAVEDEVGELVQC